ncbi:MAG: alkaline phosphatase [Alphaproteobacteria bacterium]|nr:alkaline phosphatase [Alphaproteobacteria bacterium]
MPAPRLLAACLLAALTVSASAADGPLVQSDDLYFLSADAQLRATIARQPNTRRAKNIILFVGDGMGISTVTAARIYQGQSASRDGASNKLAFEQLPYAALSRTYSDDSLVTDSAPSASAMMSGVKSRNGTINVNSTVAEQDCEAGLRNTTTTLAELAEIIGMSTGAVTTTRITHATPASVYAHSAGRDWEGGKAKKPTEKTPEPCIDIARQLVEMKYGDGLEVAMGGGRERFLPVEVADPEDQGATGARSDKLNLVDAWLKRYGDGGAFVWNNTQFAAVNPAKTNHLLALFERDHMKYELDRATDTGGEPSLAEMTAKAIAILRKNPKGFFLMVEGGRIDHAHHEGNAARALADAVAFDDAVKTALQQTDARDTLIVVTADHSHTLSISGYPPRGMSILGKVTNAEGKPSTAADGKPYTILSYANGPGAEQPVLDQEQKPIVDAPRKTREDISAKDTKDPNFLQQSLVPLSSETHGGEDVGIYASGPSAHLFQGVVDQQYIFHVMNYAGRIKQRAETAMRAGGLKKH